LHADNVPHGLDFDKPPLKLYNKVRLVASSRQGNTRPLADCKLFATLEQPAASFSDKKGFRHE